MANHACRLSVANRRTTRRAARCTDHRHEISSMWKSDTCLVSRGAEESARHLIWGACGKAGALGDCYRRSDPPRVCAWPILARLGLLLPLNRSWCFRHKTFFEVGSQSSLTRSPVSSKVDTMRFPTAGPPTPLGEGKRLSLEKTRVGHCGRIHVRKAGVRDTWRRAKLIGQRYVIQPLSRPRPCAKGEPSGVYLCPVTVTG